MAKEIRSFFFFFFFLFMSLFLSRTISVEFIFNGFSPADLVLFANATLEDRFISLTDTSHFSIGRALNKFPITARANSTAIRFSSSFIFSISPIAGVLPGHGLAFLFAPQAGTLSATSAQHLGLFNLSTDGKPASHVLAIEFDVFQNPEFRDIDANHVGVDINSLTSFASASAGFWPDNNGGDFINLTLNDGNNYQTWVDYDGGRLNVTMAPASLGRKPKRPLISVELDLSGLFKDKMWVGFCAATGKLVQRHRVLAWSFSNSNFSISQSLVTTNLPNFIPNFSDNGKLRRGLLIGFLVGAIFLLVSTVAAFMFIRKKRRYNGNEEEVMEEWEVEFWPHHISYHEIHSATNGFSENDIIGRGGNGRVYRGVISGEAVAVKVLSGSTNEELKQFLSEVSTLGRLRHRNLVTLRGWCRNRAAAMNMILVYEFMENSSLDKWIFDTCRILDWVARVRILRDVAAAVEYLHSGWGEARVLHRDIKASNVLLDSSMVGKLGDFGLARAQPYGKALGTTRVVGSAGYIAPEVVRTGKASSETDVYAFGVLVLETVTGRLAAKEGMPSLVSWVRGMADMTAAVDQKVRETKGYDEVEAERVVLLGLACTREEARARPTMKEVVRALERTAAESGSGESAEDESAEAWLLESRLKEKWWSNKEFVGRTHLTVEELRTSMSSSTGPSLSESDVIVEGR